MIYMAHYWNNNNNNFNFNLFKRDTDIVDYELDSEEETTTTSEPLPFFDNPMNLTNVSVHLGSTAFLHCKVNLLKDKTVSIFLLEIEKL